MNVSAFISRSNLTVLNAPIKTTTNNSKILQVEGQRLIGYALMLVAVIVVVIAVLFRLQPALGNALHEVIGRLDGIDSQGACSTWVTDFSGSVSVDGQSRHSVQLSYGQTITINVPAEPNFDPTITLYSPDGIRIDFDDDSGRNLGARLTTRVPQSGTYVIAVREFGGRSANFSGTFRCS